jgi:RimJ/RimL family protein N-acetyltransferase
MKQTLYGDSDAVKQWMSLRFGGPAAPPFCSTIAQVDDGELQGAVWLENYNGRSVTAHIVGQGRRWLTRRFLEDVFHYVFVVLGCRKVIGIVREANRHARQFDEKLGFRLEASIADADPEGALLIYTLRHEDCKFLKGD